MRETETERRQELTQKNTNEIQLDEKEQRPITRSRAKSLSWETPNMTDRAVDSCDLKKDPEILKENKTTLKNHEGGFGSNNPKQIHKIVHFIVILLFSTLLPVVSELRIVLLGKVRAGKSKVAKLLLGSKEPKGKIGSCVLREGEARGRKICLVDTPGWDRLAINNTSDEVKNEIVQSVTLCPPGPHALIVVLRVESDADGPPVNELKTVSQLMELLSERVWKHTMVLFLCDEEEEEPLIEEYIKSTNRLLEKCGNRHCVLRSEDQVPEFLQETEKMVEGNCGDFFLPPMYYEYMQSKMPKNLTRISPHQKQVEETFFWRRRGSLPKDRPAMNEDDQPVDIAAILSKFRDEMVALPGHYIKQAALIILAIIGALVGSVVGSAYGVTGSGVGIVIGTAVAIPLALWLIDVVKEVNYGAAR
ncbi:uncharacterized protein [Hoplias malabaricus]|uniref:uncharacterized protein n=1 Tax=Hoplias malabaricus TaxID=27720 RepID=UPI003461A54D